MAGPLDPADLMPGETGQIKRRVRVIGRNGLGANLVGDPPTPAQLHGAHTYGVGAGKCKTSVALLDHHAGHTAMAQIDGKPQPHRSSADDEDRHVGAFMVICGHRPINHSQFF